MYLIQATRRKITVLESSLEVQRYIKSIRKLELLQHTRQEVQIDSKDIMHHPHCSPHAELYPSAFTSQFIYRTFEYS